MRNLCKIVARDKNISIFHLSCRTSDLQFSPVLQTHVLSFKSVCNKEHKGVLCNMKYKVPNDIYPVSFITASHILTKKISVNTQKILASPSDFSTCPTGRVLWEELLVLSRFRPLCCTPLMGYFHEKVLHFSLYRWLWLC